LCEIQRSTETTFLRIL